MLKIPDKLTVTHGQIVTLQAETDLPNLKWIIPDELMNHSIPIPDSKKMIFSPHVEGVFTVYVYGATANIPSDPAKCELTILPEKSGWTQYIPWVVCFILAAILLFNHFHVPGPRPGPLPGPGPGPAPIDAPGFRVLFQFSKNQKLAEAQQHILESKEIRQYLEDNCAKGADGVTPDYRFWPAGDDNTHDKAAAALSKASKRSRSADDWIIISNGRTGYEGPLPTSIDETMRLLKRYKESS